MNIFSRHFLPLQHKKTLVTNNDLNLKRSCATRTRKTIICLSCTLSRSPMATYSDHSLKCFSWLNKHVHCQTINNPYHSTVKKHCGQTPNYPFIWRRSNPIISRTSNGWNVNKTLSTKLERANKMHIEFVNIH